VIPVQGMSGSSLKNGYFLIRQQLALASDLHPSSDFKNKETPDLTADP
jgi:hypothetical protein